MKHNIKYILSVCIGIALTMGLSAQTLNSSYFMEKMTKRNQLNPALKTPNGYVSFPALGNFYLGVNSNLGLGTFLYPRGNELVTFLHPSVPADDFLGKLTPNNRRTRFGIRHHLFWILGMGWTKHVQPRPQKLFGSIYAQRNIPISQNRTKRNRDYPLRHE